MLGLIYAALVFTPATDMFRAGARARHGLWARGACR